MKYIELKNLARKAFPCKFFQGKNFLARSFKENISLQDLSRKTFPCKILQVIAFLQGSCSFSNVSKKGENEVNQVSFPKKMEKTDENLKII